MCGQLENLLALKDASRQGHSAHAKPPARTVALPPRPRRTGTSPLIEIANGNCLHFHATKKQIRRGADERITTFPCHDD